MPVVRPKHGGGIEVARQHSRQRFQRRDHDVGRAELLRRVREVTPTTAAPAARPASMPGGRPRPRAPPQGPPRAGAPPRGSPPGPASPASTSSAVTITAGGSIPAAASRAAARRRVAEVTTATRSSLSAESAAAAPGIARRPSVVHRLRLARYRPPRHEVGVGPQRPDHLHRPHAVHGRPQLLLTDAVVPSPRTATPAPWPPATRRAPRRDRTGRRGRRAGHYSVDARASGVLAHEVGDQVDRPGREHGAVRTRQLARPLERRARVGDRLRRAARRASRRAMTSVAGDSERGFAGRVNTTRSTCGSSVSSMPAASLSSSTPTTATRGRRGPNTSGSEAASAVAPDGLCAPSKQRQRTLRRPPRAGRAPRSQRPPPAVPPRPPAARETPPPRPPRSRSSSRWKPARGTQRQLASGSRPRARV